MEKVYFTPKNPAALGGINPLKKAVGKTSTDTLDWLKGQRAYTLHKPARKRMSSYRKYRAPFANYQLQVDLNEMLDISSYNKGYKYIMTVIDIFSRFAYGIPLKSKTGIEVAEAFAKSVNLKNTHFVQADQGKEFYNKDFKSMLEKNNVHLFSVYSSVKCALVERFNRTLKTKMYRYFTYKGSEKWIDILDDLVESYNNTIHSAIGMTPNQAKKIKNHWLIWQRQRMKIKKAKISDVKLKLNEPVRISKYKNIFAKGYGANWSEQIYFIHSINKKEMPVMYTLRDYKNEILEGKFYLQELQSVKLPSKWPIEKVVKRRKNGRVLVKFLGYPEEYWTKL